MNKSSQPLTITPEAREAASQELVMDLVQGSRIHEQGHFVQLAINNATADTQRKLKELIKVAEDLARDCESIGTTGCGCENHTRYLFVEQHLTAFTTFKQENPEL